MRKKVLILGGSYFIGRRITECLVLADMEVTILNRGTAPYKLDGMHQINCDRDNNEQLKEVLANKQFDIVIDISWKDITWVKNICNALNFDTITDYVFLSSSAVYDVEHLTAPFTENDALASNKYWTTYGTGKIEAERYYTYFLSEKQTRLIILRPPYVYGEYNYAQRESLMFRQIMDNQPILVPKSNPTLQFIYTTDLANIILTLLLHNQDKLSVYNVGNKIAYTAIQWAEICGEVTGVKANIIPVDYEALSYQIRDFYPFYDYDNVLDVSKIHRIYSEETDFKVGLSSSFQWFTAHRHEIVFKPNVDQTIQSILEKISI